MMKSLIPIGRDSSLARTEANPLAMLQHEMDRLFDGFSRSFTGLSSRTLMPSMEKKIIILSSGTTVPSCELSNCRRA